MSNIDKTKESSDWFWSHCVEESQNLSKISEPLVMGTFVKEHNVVNVQLGAHWTFLFSFNHFCRVQMLAALTPGQHLTAMTGQFV